MKIARLAGLMLAAMFAISLVSASVAMAEPEFKQTGVPFTGTSGTSILSANNGADKVICPMDIISGLIVTVTRIDGVMVTYLGCVSSGPNGSNCSVNSTNQTSGSGLILTASLIGTLGLQLPRSGTGVGILILPASGSEFVTLQENGCTETSKITGSVAGEVQPINHKQKTGKVVFTVSGTSKAGIKGFMLPGGTTITAKLTGFTAEASEESTEEIEFNEEVEVS